MTNDKDTNVRLRAALALAPQDNEAIPVLIELIGVLDAERASQAHDFLCQLAGEKAPSHPEDTSDARKKCSTEWAAWWKDNSAKVDLAKLTSSHSHMLGFTVICEANTGQVVEIGKDGKLTRWSFGGVLFPVDAWVLPNNRVLVAECNGAKVTERDFKGNIVWQRQGLNGSPVNVQRLPNGNTFIATNVNLLEVDRNGKDVMMLNNVGGITAAYKAKNGHIIAISQNGQCIRFDNKGKQLKSFNSGRVGGWTSGIDLLANGNILIAQPNANKTVEFSPDGKVVMEFNTPQVTTATALPNGNILAASSNLRQVLEIDRRGRTVWTFNAGPGGAFRARRR
jgi:hypothetical protein